MRRNVSLGYIVAVLAGILIVGITVGLTTNTSNAQIEPSTKLTVTDSPEDRENVLWLARAIYSETKRPWEMGIIAWVVRNRVETEYMGSTYKGVVLRKNQFSGLNPSDRNYQHNISRSYESSGQKWTNALIVAKAIYYADDSLRPMPKTVRHFYSPRSMKNGATPSWTANARLIHTITDPYENSIRFAFYDSVK
ncbi:MAG: cell wall hydrolase [Candidatus Paceibacterota bacterium]